MEKEGFLNVESKKKYVPGFKREWFEDKKLMEKSKRMAAFFTERFGKLELDVQDNELALIHFTDNLTLEQIESSRVIKNHSKFFDVDSSWLAKNGCDVEKIRDVFGEPSCVVSIPLGDFDKWANTLSWIKGVRHNAFKNAVVFTAPKDSVILRNHRFVEESFKADLNLGQRGFESRVGNVISTYNSTQKYDDDSVNLQDFMPEIWVPKEIELDDYNIVKYEGGL